MRKIAKFLTVSFIFLALVIPNKVSAYGNCGTTTQGLGSNAKVPEGASSYVIKVDVGQWSSGSEYQLVADPDNIWYTDHQDSPSFTVGQDTSSPLKNSTGTLTVKGSTVTWTITEPAILQNEAKNGYNVDVFLHPAGNIMGGAHICQFGTYKTALNTNTTNGGSSCQLQIYQERNGKKCYQTGCLKASGVETSIVFTNITDKDGNQYNGDIDFSLNKPGYANSYYGNRISITNGNYGYNFSAVDVGKYEVSIENDHTGETLCSKYTFYTDDSDNCSNDCGEFGNAYEGTNDGQPFKLCEQIPNASQALECGICFEKNGVWTAIGCVPIDPQGIIKTLITLALSLGGGVTLLLILAGAFRLSVSAGDPKAAEEAKEQITSAVIGLIFIIFSIVMLRFIGIQVLQIPGFGT